MVRLVGVGKHRDPEAFPLRYLYVLVAHYVGFAVPDAASWQVPVFPLNLGKVAPGQHEGEARNKLREQGGFFGSRVWSQEPVCVS